MVKQYIPFKKYPAKSCCNHAFYGVKGHLSGSLKETEDHDSDLAAVLGTIGGFYAALSGELTSILFNILGANIPLEDITIGCLYGVGIASSATVIAKYEKVVEWIKDEPRFSAGVNWVLAGTSLKAVTPLEEFIRQYI